MAPLLSPEQQRAEVEHFVKGLQETHLRLAQLEAWAAEYDRLHP